MCNRGVGEESRFNKSSHAKTSSNVVEYGRARARIDASALVENCKTRGRRHADVRVHVPVNSGASSCVTSPKTSLQARCDRLSVRSERAARWNVQLISSRG